ncbi:hypothetical protein [Adlercreutzia sp. ZJ304]|uniref:hypothetical protein n=1 Tax=Adlercreutzia sp. ZJ304 TaxID=2709791 RepID=UPI0013ED5AB7|nr:hypothetical protein [Adlercreutzia sp. ZJ304]
MNTTNNQMQTKHVIFITCAIVLLAISVGVSAIVVTSTGLQRQFAEAETPDAQTQTCTHIFQPDTKLVHHDAVTYEVQHPATYETVSVPHTVCNICNETIDGKTEEHRTSTGHSGYTTNVPIAETHQKTKEWTEVVVANEAYDELVTETETCTSCGEVRAVEQ